MLTPWLKARGVTDLTPFADWLATMRLREVARDAHLVRAGETSPHVFFIAEGLLRLYYTTPDGRERNKAFYGEGSMVGAVSAAIRAQPSAFSIQALEPARLIQAEFPLLYHNAHAHAVTARTVIDLLSEAFIRNERREAMLLTLGAEDRYRWLQDCEPELLERVPQFHLASYIGIDPVSLSRLKRSLRQD